MKDIQTKTIITALIISILLSACGGVKGPDPVSWNTPAENPGMSSVDPDAYLMPTPNLSVPQSESIFEIPPYQPTVDSMALGVCSLVHQNAGLCFGNEKMGFRKLEDGSYKVLFKDICYIIDASNEDEISSMKTAMNVISDRTEEVNKISGKTGLQSIALVTTIIAALGTCGVIGSATPVGWLCGAAAVGVAAALGLTIYDVIDIHTANNEIEDQTEAIATILSGKQFCGNN